ncbi:P-loop NTPase fold protein [Monashia sp. NPDC004114]
MVTSRDVFVSYSHNDHATVAQLVGALRARGLSVRWDDDVPAGSRFDQELTKMLGDAAVVVVVWSAESAKSSFVLREAAIAQDESKLLPVSIDGTVPPAFRAMQTVMLTEWRGEPDDPLIERLASDLSAWQVDPDAVEAATSAASKKGETEVPSRRPLRPAADELLRLALSVSLLRGAKDVSALDVLLAILVQPEHTQLDLRQLAAGATALVREMVPAPSDERVSRAMRSVGVDRRKVVLQDTDADTYSRLLDVIRSADSIAGRVGAREIYAHHVLAAALDDERIEPVVLSSLGVDEKDLRTALRNAIGLRWRSESAVEWDSILGPVAENPWVPPYLDRVFAIDTLGSQGIRGIAVLVEDETVVTSLAAVDGLPFVDIESLGTKVSSQAGVVRDDGADPSRRVAVLAPQSPLEATSAQLSLGVGPAVRGDAVDVVMVASEGELRVVRGSVSSPDPSSLSVEVDTVAPDVVVAGAPILAGGRVIGLAASLTERMVTAVSSDVLRSVIEGLNARRGAGEESAAVDVAADSAALAASAASAASADTASRPDDSTTPPPETQSGPAARPAGRAQLLAGAAADTVPRPGDGRVRKADRLGVTEEVEMLVSVLLAKDTPLPLAVGLFGDWGSGKSFFMALMEERMGELSSMAGKKVPEAMPYCGNVRTVRFNAWHYVDADLWASLAATLFDALADGAEEDAAAKALDALDSARSVVDTAKEDRIELERQLDVLEKSTGKATAAWRPSVAVALHVVRGDKDLAANLKTIVATEQAVAEDQTVEGQAGAPTTQAGAPTTQAGAPSTAASTDDANRLAEALGAAETVGQQVQNVRRLFREEVLHRSRTATLVTFFVLLVAAGWLAWGNSWDTAQKALAVVVAGAAALAPALAATTRILSLAREAREARERPLELKREAVVKARATEEFAEREVERRERDVRDIHDQGLQLQNFVRERAASADYRSRLGVMSQLRHDFEQLVALISSTSSDGASQNGKSQGSAALSDEGPSPASADGPATQQVRSEPGTEGTGEVRAPIKKAERIVLFIDDLDRCPDDKVVAVLQAVHLLLAFELFVVVVGVDSRWLVRSLDAHFENLLEEPSQYLEKIFQIPYILRRMSTDSYRDLIVELTPPPKTPPSSGDERRGPGPAPASPGLPGSNGNSSVSQQAVVDSETGTPSTADGPGANGAPAGEPAPPARGAQPAPEDGAGQDDAREDDAGQDDANAHDTASGEHAAPDGHRETEEPEDHAEAPAPEAPPALPRSEALFISSEERRLLGELDGLSLTPRSTKRLVNIYRMLRVSVPDTELSDFDPEHGREFEVVVVLLGILVGRPSDVSDVFSALMSQPKEAVFKDFLEAAFPHVYKPLEDLVVAVEPHGMPVYQRWAPRVARFSFRMAGGIPAVSEGPQEPAGGESSQHPAT